jgi:hypothetical protein
VRNRNEKLLNEFIEYCKSHPDERFWQCLRNWSGQPFILASKDAVFEINDEDVSGIRDTFYWEGKEK